MIRARFSADRVVLGLMCPALCLIPLTVFCQFVCNIKACYTLSMIILPHFTDESVSAQSSNYNDDQMPSSTHRTCTVHMDQTCPRSNSHRTISVHSNPISP